MNGEDIGIPEIEVYSDDELREMTEGCNELTCLIHGAIVWTLQYRGLR